MNGVIFDVLTNGPGSSPNTERLLGLAALRLRNGAVVETLDSLIQAPCPWPTWLSESELRSAALLPEALATFSAFVGEEPLLAERAPTCKMPFLHEASARLGLATRPVRVLDLDDVVRRLPVENPWQFWRQLKDDTTGPDPVITTPWNRDLWRTAGAVRALLQTPSLAEILATTPTATGSLPVVKTSDQILST